MYEAIRKWWKPILISSALLASSNVAGMPAGGERRGDAPRAIVHSPAPRAPSMPAYQPQRVEAPRQHYQPAAPLRAESRPAPSRADAPRQEPRYEQAPRRADPPRVEVERWSAPPRADAPRQEPQHRPAPPRDASPRDSGPRDNPRAGPRDQDPGQGPRHDGYRPPRAEPSRPRDHRPPVFLPAHPRGDHPRPGVRPPHHRPYWDWRNHCRWDCSPYFTSFGWWGSWCWDAPHIYRSFATPISVVESFAIPPPPGYDSADVSYFKNGPDRTVRVELTRERRDGLELTVLRDDNAGCEERPFSPCRNDFSRLDQVVVIRAADRENAVRRYWQDDQGSFRKEPGLFNAIYESVIYPDVRDRLVAERLW